MSKVTEEEFKRFQHAYFENTREFVGQRFGQAFMNKFLPGVTDPELFYAVRTKDAETYIRARYIIHE